MKNPNHTVVSETKYIAAVVAILSAILQAVFLIIGKWDYKVLISNMYSDIFMVLNFYLMGISVVKAVGKDENDARKIMKTSMSLRTLMLFVAVALGVLIPVFNIFAVVIPLFFPRIAIFLRPLYKKNSTKKEDENDATENSV